jgi:hypothetical protein
VDFQQSNFFGTFNDEVIALSAHSAVVTVDQAIVQANNVSKAIFYASASQVNITHGILSYNFTYTGNPAGVIFVETFSSLT